MAQIRRQEAVTAMSVLGASMTMLSFPVENVQTPVFHFQKKIREKRNQFLTENYRSQFSIENQAEWQMIFNVITRRMKKHAERYINVR